MDDDSSAIVSASVKELYYAIHDYVEVLSFCALTESGKSTFCLKFQKLMAEVGSFSLEKLEKSNEKSVKNETNI
jgi:hypothetical protein